MSVTVALTGATGFVGTALRKVLVEAGHDVRALTRTPRDPDRGITWIHGDLASPDSLADLVRGSDAVIHCAGAVRGASREDFIRVNVAGTAALLNAVDSHAPRCRFLLVSSIAARCPELSWYAASKAEAEALVRSRERLSWTIFRPTAVYGPGDRELRPLFEWLSRGVLFTPQPVHGRFSLLHVEDLAGAVLHWLTQISTAGSVYELSDATPGGYDALSLANLAEKNLGRRPLVVRLPRWLLTACGYLILTAARATGRAPMLTPGKVRELTHPDWTADAAAYMRDTGWLPRLRLEDVLAPGRWFFT